MLSSNLLKSKIPISGEGGEGGTNFQLLMLSSNLLKSKIPISGGGGGGVGGTNFQLLMLSPNLLKKKKKKKIFLRKFFKFSGKNVLENGFRLRVPSGSHMRSICEPQSTCIIISSHELMITCIPFLVKGIIHLLDKRYLGIAFVQNIDLIEVHLQLFWRRLTPR